MRRAVAIALLAASSYVARARAVTDEEAGRARVERQTPSAIVATGPLSTRLPLLGVAGKDRDGYPTQYVDRAAFVGLLRMKRFDLLEQHFSTIQGAFEKDWHHEYWADDAAAAFQTADPSLAPLLDAWVAAEPRSWAALLARGSFEMHRGYTQRGFHNASRTHATDLAAMELSEKKAVRDLNAALALRPKAVAALSALMNAYNATSDRDGLARARGLIGTICPACMRPRVVLLHCLKPRWGGSYADMMMAAHAAPIAKNPRLRFLAGFADLDRAQVAELDAKLDEALASIEKASALGDYWMFLYERGVIDLARKQYDAAEHDFARALEQRPNDPETLYEHAAALDWQKKYEAAGLELLAAVRVDPSNSRARGLVGPVVSGLTWQAGQLIRAGKQADAVRVSEIATSLAPTNHDAQVMHTWAIAGGQMPQATDIESLKAQVAASPDDFALHQKLDLAFARQRRFADVVEMWNTYIAAHPTNARAYLERGGAQYHLGRRDDAGRDARKACDLGESEGCMRAQQFGK